MKAITKRVFVLALASSCTFILAAASVAIGAPTIGLQYSGAQIPNESAEEWDVIQKSGAAVYRLQVTPELSSNGTSWTYYDKVFRLAAERGVEIWPYLHGRFHGQTDGLPTETTAEGEEWYAWISRAVKRYGYNGTFWAENPGVPAIPATNWEVWNEPNNKEHWIEPTAFGKFLAVSGAVIQNASLEQAGKETRVIFGGLLVWNNGTSYQSYLSQAFKVPGVSGVLAGVAVHPYQMGLTSPIESLSSSVNGIRSYLNTLPGGKSKSLSITEIGWSTEFEYAVSEQKQADLLREGLTWLKGAATADNIQSIIWYNYRDSDLRSTWDYRCGLRDEMGNFRPAWFAFQEETGASRWPQSAVAFQANTGSLWTYTRLGGGKNTLLGMAKGTSPSTGQYHGSYQIAFQGNTGTLFTATQSAAENTGLKMATGTSPSVPAQEGGVVAYQASNGDLAYKEGSTVIDSGYGMAPGTSPSVTVIPARYWHNPTRYAFAFQANTGQLLILEPGRGVVNTGLGMAPGTSPAIAALDSPEGENKRYAVAFQANTGQLWLYEPGGTVASTGLGMQTGTSPSITSLAHGKYAIAFQASTGTLWTYVPGGAVTNTGYGMQAPTSPGISALGDTSYYREFEAAIHASSGSLWTFEPGGYVTNTLFGNQPGTSPSIGPG